MVLDLKYIIEKCEHDHRFEQMDLLDLAKRVAKEVTDECARRMMRVPCGSAQAHEMMEQLVMLQRELCGE